MGQELQVPAVFQNKGMAKAFQGHVNPHDDNLADGIGQSYPVMRYKGKVWSLQHRGERKTIVRADDGTPSGHLDVIVLGQAKSKSKSFYKKYDPNGSSEGERPICASIDGIVPDADVTLKQSDTCALCPRNVWKVNDEGRKGRECTDYKRLAILVMPTQTAAAFGQPLVEPVFLRVPPDSLNSLAIMGDTMTKQGFHYSTYWTRITFDPVKAHPCMVFRPLQPVKEDEADVIIEMRNSAVVDRITGGDVAQQGMRQIEQMAPAGSVSSGLTAPVTPQPAPQTEPEPEEEFVGLGGLAQAPSIAPAPKPVTPRGRPAGSKNKVVEPPAQEVAPPQGNGGNGHIPDEGVSEPSDDELDAEIAKLISR